jgi:excisionase family DNA binding protein
MGKSSNLDEVVVLCVPFKQGCQIIGVGPTRGYELVNSGEIKSYRDGKSRKLVFASLKAYVERQIAAEAVKPRSAWTDRATQVRMSKKAGSGRRGS